MVAALGACCAAVLCKVTLLLVAASRRTLLLPLYPCFLCGLQGRKLLGAAESDVDSVTYQFELEEPNGRKLLAAPTTYRVGAETPYDPRPVYNSQTFSDNMKSAVESQGLTMQSLSEWL